MVSCIAWCTIAISGRGEYKVLAVRLLDSCDDGLEVSLLASLLLWEGLWSWKRSCCWSPNCWIHSLLDLWLPQICLYHCESCPHWNLNLPLSQRIFLFVGVLWSWKVKYYLKYFQLLCYCQKIFHFGRVYQSWNEECYFCWYCHSCELEIGPMVVEEGLFRQVAFSYVHH